MPQPMYSLDCRRMTVEEIADPTPPPGSHGGTPPTAEDPGNVGITFAVMGSPPRHGGRDDEA